MEGMLYCLQDSDGGVGFKLWVVCNDGKVVEGVLYVQSMMFG